MGAVIYSSGMCVDCYKEYLENAGGQLQGHNPPAYTQGLIKASKQQVLFSLMNCIALKDHTNKLLWRDKTCLACP